MKNLKIPALTEVPEQNRKILRDLQLAFGFVPNVYAFMAYSPMALKSYLHYTREKTSLTDVEAEAVYLATSQVNACHYCLSAHTSFAKAIGLQEEQILELRAGRDAGDERIDALVKFTRAVVEGRGHIDDAVVKNFMKAGYTFQHLVEVVLLISQIMVTNFINNITHNPVDFPEAPEIPGKGIKDAGNV